MNLTKTPLDGLLLLEPKILGDERGYFFETYNERLYQANGIALRFVQDNESYSHLGILRGLHYQLKHPQGKLVRVVNGEVFDVAVDIRQGSPSYGKWYGVRLSGKNKHQFYIPPGFAHGFCVLSETAEFLYKCTDFYYPEDEYGIRWDDPALQIQWPLPITPTLSQKDQALPLLKDVNPERLPQFSRTIP